MADHVNLSEFNFETFGVPKNRKGNALYDVMVSYKNKGRIRKTSNYGIFVTQIAVRDNVTLKMMAIGSNKYKRGGRVVLVFNNSSLKDHNIDLYSNKESRVVLCNSKSHVVRLLEEFGVEVPNKPDTSVALYLKADKIEGQPYVYNLSPVRATYTDATGKTDIKEMK